MINISMKFEGTIKLNIWGVDKLKTRRLWKHKRLKFSNVEVNEGQSFCLKKNGEGMTHNLKSYKYIKIQM